MSKSRRRGRYEHEPEPGAETKRSRLRGTGDSSLWSGLRRSSTFQPRIGTSVKVGAIAFGVLALTGLWLFRDQLAASFDPPSTTSIPVEPAEAGATGSAPSTTSSPPDVDAQVLLDSAGFAEVAATEVDGVIYLDGVIPSDRLESGLFSYVRAARAAVLEGAPDADVRSRLRVRGDPGALAQEIQRLVGDRPVVFEDGSFELSDSSRSTLAELAAVINAHPGVVVAVAGHTDAGGTTARNREISVLRAAAVLEELVARGVSANRLTVLGYGEAFPVQGAEPSGRIEFEVVG